MQCSRFVQLVKIYLFNNGISEDTYFFICQVSQSLCGLPGLLGACVRVRSNGDTDHVTVGNPLVRGHLKRDKTVQVSENFNS